MTNKTREDKIHEETKATDNVPPQVSHEVAPKDKVLVRCPHCPWKPGLLDEHTICDSCNGSGKVAADPLE